MDNSAVRSDPNVIYGETYMVTLINSTKYFDPKDSSAELGQEALDLAVCYIRDFLEEMKQIELSS